jgi:hypothetical protein
MNEKHVDVCNSLPWQQELPQAFFKLQLVRSEQCFHRTYISFKPANELRDGAQSHTRCALLLSMSSR